MTAVISAGLPNFTGWFTSGNNSGHVPGADGTLFYKDGTTSNAASLNANDATRICFNPSRANSIYGKSKTVQPPAIQFVPQIKY